MRKIKFRVRDGNTKEIIGYENFNTSLNSGYYYIDIREPIADADGNVDYICRTEYSEKPMLRSAHPLARLIREQYTGIKDCNGFEIYEGDLIQLLKPKSKYAFTVDFKNDYVGGWVLTHKDAGMWVSLGARGAEEIKVIGNIYENPELFEANK